MKFFRSIKFRLTVWYLVVIVVLMLVFSGAAYFMLSRNLNQGLDNALRTRSTELKTQLESFIGRAIYAQQPGETALLYAPNRLLLQSFGPGLNPDDIDALISQVTPGNPAFMTAFTEDGQQARLYADVVGIRNILIVGRLTNDIQDVLENFRYIVLIAGLGVIVLAGGGGLFLATRALNPVDRITRTARQIGESNLDRHIGVQSDDELGRLASTLNGMIDRLREAFDRQRQFTADASHELRTPLAIVQAESTLALSKARSEGDYRKSLEMVAQETDYMSSLIGKLLFLARSDAGKEPLNNEEMNLSELLKELASSFEVLATDKDIKFNLDPVENVTVRGDRTKLRQLFINLLENAVRYTPGGGSVHGSVIRNKDVAVVSITDTGIGIPPEHLSHIFERFYRVDKARSRAEGGAGLGLSIARYIAEAHGGSISVDSEVGRGTTFTVTLPAVS